MDRTRILRPHDQFPLSSSRDLLFDWSCHQGWPAVARADGVGAIGLLLFRDNKQDTDTIANWLAEKAKQCSCPSDFLDASGEPENLPSRPLAKLQVKVLQKK